MLVWVSVNLMPLLGLLNVQIGLFLSNDLLMLSGAASVGLPLNFCRTKQDTMTSLWAVGYYHDHFFLFSSFIDKTIYQFIKKIIRRISDNENLVVSGCKLSISCLHRRCDQKVQEIPLAN